MVLFSNLSRRNFSVSTAVAVAAVADDDESDETRLEVLRTKLAAAEQNGKKIEAGNLKRQVDDLEKKLAARATPKVLQQSAAEAAPLMPPVPPVDHQTDAVISEREPQVSAAETPDVSFQKLKDLPYQTLETFLLMLMSNFKFERTRDMNQAPLMALAEIDSIVNGELIPGFEKSGQITFIMRDKLKSICTLSVELDSFIKQKYEYFQGALMEYSNRYSALNRIVQGYTNGLIDPISCLTDFFDGKKDPQLCVQDQFQAIQSWIDNYQNTAALKEVVKVLSEMCGTWSSVLKRKDTDSNKILANCDALMNQIRAVDFSALIKLLQDSKDQSECLNNELAVFLVGCTGAGKSTLLQLLGGSTFEVIEVKGANRMHYKPIPPANKSDLKRFITSPYGRSETSTVNCYRLHDDGRIVWLVDTPGLGDTEGVVKQIANAVGIVQALQRCSKVKVVFCVSDYDLGNRVEQQGFVDLCTSVMQFFKSAEDKRELTYVVSKLQNPEKGLKNLAATLSKGVQDRPDHNLTKQLWVDFIEKIESDQGTHAVNLMDPASRCSMLQDLTNFEIRVISNPQTAFEEFIPSECKEPLARQFQLHVKAIEQAIDSGKVALVKDKVAELHALTGLLRSKDCVDSFHKAIAKLQSSLSEHWNTVAAISNALLDEGRVWNPSTRDVILNSFRQLVAFNDYFREQVLLLLKLVPDCEAESQPESMIIKTRDFVKGIAELVGKDLEKAYIRFFSERMKRFELENIRAVLANVDYLAEIVKEVPKEVYDIISPTMKAFQAAGHDMLLTNFDQPVDTSLRDSAQVVRLELEQVIDAVKDAADRFVASLRSSDLTVALQAFNHQIFLWKRINYLDAFSSVIVALVVRLEELISSIAKEATIAKGSFLSMCLRHKDTILYAIDSIALNAFDCVNTTAANAIPLPSVRRRAITKTGTVQTPVESLKSALQQIIQSLRGALSSLFKDAEKLIEIFSFSSEHEIAQHMKRVPALARGCRELMNFQGMFGVLAEMADAEAAVNNDNGNGGAPVSGGACNDPTIYTRRLKEIYLQAQHFFRDVNKDTINANTADREAFYHKVAINYLFLDSVNDWMPTVIKQQAQKKPSNEGGEASVADSIADHEQSEDESESVQFLTMVDINSNIAKNIAAWKEKGEEALQDDGDGDSGDANETTSGLEVFNTAASNLHLIAKLLPELHPEFETATEESVKQLDGAFFEKVDELKQACINVQASDGESVVENVVEKLSALQRLGNAVTVHSKRVSSTIGQIINKHVDMEKKRTGGDAQAAANFISKIGVALNESNDGSGQQILAEHGVFKGYQSFLRNTRFTQLTLEQMIADLTGTDLDKALLAESARAFTDMYWKEVQDYLGPKNRQKIKDIPDLARGVAKAGQKRSWETVLQIIVYVFAFWTLSDIKQFDESGTTDVKYLLQPHLGQVICILRLFGFDSNNYQNATTKTGLFSWNWFADKAYKLQNHLVQVRTGEGKSVILGVMSIVLALMNFEVHCVCYSKHLSERDYQEFEALFRAFGVDDSVFYGTFNELCEKMLNADGNIREMVEKTITTGSLPASRGTSKGGKAKHRLLLIDEVDVFFQPGFYGSVYNVKATLKAAEFPAIEELVLFIWKLRHSSKSEDRLLKDVKESKEFKACCDSFKEDWHKLIEEAVKEMLSTLASFGNHAYIFDKDRQQIGYLDSDNTISFHKVKGYNTMFAYCLEYVDNKSLTREQFSRNVHVLIHAASFSYAEFPKYYEGILGVSGTLKTLSKQETDILAKDYKLCKFTYLPSAYGREPVLWSANALGSIVVTKEHTFFTNLADEIRRRQGEQAVKRPVLVFFRTKAEIEMFREDPAFAVYRDHALVLYAGMKEENRVENIRKAMEKGRITLLTREFGRGVNFYCQSKEIEGVGGAHVISTFVSIEISEEVQIMGRTGRQGCSGSFSMVLPMSQMDLIGINDAILQDMESSGKRYDTIHRYRLKAYEDAFPERLKFIEQIKEEHDRSQVFVRDLKDGKRDAVREFLFGKNASQFGDVHSRTVIALDATGSMSHLLQQAKITVTAMLNRVVEVLKDNHIASGFQIQFIVYRNYNSHPDKILECSTWETAPANLVQFIDPVGPDGGWGNEAIEMALWHVNQEAANMEVTQMIIIGDAPPNSRDETNAKRANSPIYAQHPRYGTPVYFEEQLQEILKKKIRINSFYIKGTSAKVEFQRMAAFTSGSCEALDVHSPVAADTLTGIVSTNILQDIGRKLGGNLAQQLVDSYRAKYPFQSEGFI